MSKASKLAGKSIRVKAGLAEGHEASASTPALALAPSGERRLSSSGLPPLAENHHRQPEEQKVDAHHRKEIKQFLQSEKRTIVKEVKDLERKNMAITENYEKNERLSIQADEKEERKKAKRLFSAGLKEWNLEVSVSQFTTPAVTPTHRSQFRSLNDGMFSKSLHSLENDSVAPRDDVNISPPPIVSRRLMGHSRHSSFEDSPAFVTEIHPNSDGPDSPPRIRATVQPLYLPLDGEEASSTDTRWISDAIQRERDLQREIPKSNDKARLRRRESLSRLIREAKEAAERLNGLTHSSRVDGGSSPPLSSRTSSGLPLLGRNSFETSTKVVQKHLQDRGSSPIPAHFSPEELSCRESSVPAFEPARSPARSSGDQLGAEQLRHAWGPVEDAIQNSLVLHQAAIASCNEELTHCARRNNDSNKVNWIERVTVLVNKVREEVKYRKSLDAALDATKKENHGRKVTKETISGIEAETFKLLSTELRSCILGLQEQLQTRREDVKRVKHMLRSHSRQTQAAHDRAETQLRQRCGTFSEPQRKGSSRSTRASPASPLAGVSAPPPYIVSMWGEEHECQELWWRKGGEVDRLYRQQLEEVEGPLRDLEQAFIIGGAAGGSAKWKVLLDDMYHVAVNGVVWRPSDPNSLYPFTLHEKYLRQQLAPRHWRRRSGLFLCLLVFSAVVSLQYKQYEAN